MENLDLYLMSRLVDLKYIFMMISILYFFTLFIISITGLRKYFSDVGNFVVFLIFSCLFLASFIMPSYLEIVHFIVD